MDRRTELSPGEMQERFSRRVRELYGMNIEQYRAARKNGTLPRLPGSVALEVFSGEAAEGQSQANGAEPVGGQRPLARLHSTSNFVRERNGSALRRAISAGLRKLRFTGAF